MDGRGFFRSFTGAGLPHGFFCCLRRFTRSFVRLHFCAKTAAVIVMFISGTFLHLRWSQMASLVLLRTMQSCSSLSAQLRSGCNKCQSVVRNKQSPTLIGWVMHVQQCSLLLETDAACLLCLRRYEQGQFFLVTCLAYSTPIRIGHLYRCGTSFSMIGTMR